MPDDFDKIFKIIKSELDTLRKRVSNLEVWEPTTDNTSGIADNTASYLTLGTDASLDNERVFVAGSALSSVDGGAGGNFTVNLDITELAADASPDAAADYVVTYDASTNSNKKVLLTNLPASSVLGDYLLRNGTLAMTGNLDLGGYNINNTHTIYGRGTDPFLLLWNDNANGCPIVDLTQFSGAVGTSTIGSKLHFAARRGTFASKSPVANNDILGRIDFAGYHVDAIDYVAATIRTEVDGVPGTKVPGRMIFETNTGSGAAEALRIDSNQETTFVKAQILTDITTPTDPPAGYIRLYSKSGQLYYKTGSTEVGPLVGATVYAPTNAEYLTLSLNGTLTNERRLVAGNGLGYVDGGANGDYTLSVNVDNSTIEIDTDTLRLKDTAVVANTYTKATITVDSKGRITSASSGSVEAPVDAQYLTLATNGTLTNERRFIAGTGISSNDGGAGGDYTIALDINELTEDTTPNTATDYVATYDTSTSTTKKALIEVIRADPAAFNARLTLLSNNAVPAADLTAQSTIYLTPFNGNRLTLWDGTRDIDWILASELSLDISNTTNYPAYSIHDVFVNWNSGSPALASEKWTDTNGAITSSSNVTPIVLTLPAGHGLVTGDMIGVYGHDQTAANGTWTITVSGNSATLLGSVTSGTGTNTGNWRKLNVARATALASQSGYLAKTGATTYRYAGSFMITGTAGKTEDTLSNATLINAYNQVWRPLAKHDSTADPNNWTDAGGAWNPAHADATNKLRILAALPGMSVSLIVACSVAHNNAITGAWSVVGIGRDTPGANHALATGFAATVGAMANAIIPIYATLDERVSSGATPLDGLYHEYYWVERCQSATATYYGRYVGSDVRDACLSGGMMR